MEEHPTGRVTSSVDADSGTVFTQMQGDVGGADLFHHVARLLGRADLPQPYRELCDLRGVGSFAISPSDVRRIVDIVRRNPRFDGARVAIVADRDLVYGMARLASLLSEAVQARYRIEAFRDLAKAASWLRAPPAPFTLDD